MAQNFGAAKVIDGIVQGAATEVTGDGWKEVDVPQPGDMIQKVKIWTKGPKAGTEEKIGTPYARRAPSERGILTTSDYARYDLQIKDDAYKAATRELMSRGQMRLVQDPMNPGSMTIQFAVPADIGDKLLREAYAKAYMEGVRSAKQNRYLPPEWSEDPFGTPAESPKLKEEDFAPSFQKWMKEHGESKFGPKSSTQPIEKKEGKTIGRFKLND
jgi:hypothetical protein